MARNYTGSRTSTGERTFTSDSDGDRGSDKPQKLYREHKGGGGSSRVNTTYDPKTGKSK